MADGRGPAPAQPAQPAERWDSGWDAREMRTREGRIPVPQSFQTRLTFAFLSLVAVTLALVAPAVINRIDAAFRDQEEESLRSRAYATAQIVAQFVLSAVPSDQVVLRENADGSVDANPVLVDLMDGGFMNVMANTVGQADATVTFGLVGPDTDGTPTVQLEPDITWTGMLKEAGPGERPGFSKDSEVAPQSSEFLATDAGTPWGLRVTLTNSYTNRASALNNITAVILLMASIAFVVAVALAALLAHRFATPLMRLSDASRRLAEGDLSSRVAADELTTGTLEIREVSQQFNAMADRLEESVSIIRRDRDYSRDFAADVSHELRTPIAALKMHVELLQGPAGESAAARTEFLHSSAEQLDRLDWLAQNLLELSKLDSGLVLLELRPEDVRGTIESAVEQQRASAERRGITLVVTTPDRPVRIRHDPPRVGQIVSNLVGNALKFTRRGGEVRVAVRQDADGGARIEVVDTGVGIQPAELPRIFDRFYRGSQENEARSTGSGLGLAIVKSIVDMHHGSIAVESRVGVGSRFVIRLPRDPREETDPEPPEPDDAAPLVSQGAAGGAEVTPAGEPAAVAKMDDSSPTEPSTLNPHPAP